jgi:hypothetical protein
MSEKLQNLISKRDQLNQQIEELVQTERAELKAQMRQLESLTGVRRKRRTMSDEGRAAIAASKKAYWAKKKAKESKKVKARKPKSTHVTVPETAIAATA